MLFASRDTAILVQEQLNAVFDKTTGNFNLFTIQQQQQL